MKLLRKNMINTKCNELKNLAGQVSNYQQESKLIETLKAKQTLLTENLESLEKLITTIQIIDEINNKTQLKSRIVINHNTLKGLIKELKKLKLDFENDFNTILVGNYFGVTITTSSGLIKTALEKRDEIWKGFSSAIRSKFFQEGILEFRRKLTNKSSDFDNINSVKDIQDKLEVSLKNFPQKIADLNKIFDLQLEFIEKVKTLPSTKDEDIENFVNDAHNAEKGVLISGLTPKIRNWLEENQLDSNYRIYSRKNNG